MKTDPATLKRIYAMSLAGVYPHYIAKAETGEADGEVPPEAAGRGHGFVRLDTEGVNAPNSSAAAPSPDRQQAV